MQGSQEHQLPGSNPRTGRLKTYALTIGPCVSLALYVGAAGRDSNPKGGGRVLLGVPNKGWLESVGTGCG